MRLSKTLLTLSLGLFMTGGAYAASASDEDTPNPYLKADGSWISLSGTITSTSSDQFVLDYGPGSVIVEMDDWDAYDEASPFIKGDKATVHGRIDDDFLEPTTIEASNVYIEDIASYFFASADDEEDLIGMSIIAPVIPKHMHLQGKISSVDTNEQSFTLKYGKESLKIDASGIGYNAFDDLGFQKLEAGDQVCVHAPISENLFNDKAVTALTVISLTPSDNQSPMTDENEKDDNKQSKTSDMKKKENEES